MHKEPDDAADRFLGLLRPIAAELEGYCRRLIHEPGDAADALQNAVLRGCRAFDRYVEGASFKAWMFRILTNEIFALNRKRGRIARFEIAMDPEQLDEAAGGGMDATSGDWLFTGESSWNLLVEALDQEIVEALGKLNDAERAVLLLRAIPGLRYREISEALDIPLGSVMGNLSHARRKMRDAILRHRRRACP
jgi:RNA polymerase sigma-70 factor (ECF subfamily)